MKRGFKYLLLLFSTLLFTLSGYLLITHWVLISPDGKFAHSLEYREFSVHSDRPIDKQLLGALDSVSIRLSSVLDYKGDRYEIYICNAPKTYGLFADKVGRPEKSQGFNLQPLNYVFINASFVQEMKSRNDVGFQYHIMEGNLSHIIAHEICHQLIANRVGFIRMRNVDSWKLEGFCEYAASAALKKKDPSYRFRDFVDSFLTGRFDAVSDIRKFYIESMMLTEYYLDYKNKDIIDLVNEKQSRMELLRELVLKHQTKRL